MRTAHDQKLTDSALSERKTLSPKQAEFLHAFAATPYASISALCKQVGVKNSQVTYWKKNSAAFKAAMEKEYNRSQQVANVNRKTIIRGLLDAVDLAKDMRQPTGMISGYKEIGRMCGFYEPERREIRLSVDSKQLLEELQTLPKERLLEMLNEQEAIDAEFEVIDKV